jgi:hypothetical protein
MYPYIAIYLHATCQDGRPACRDPCKPQAAAALSAHRPAAQAQGAQVSHCSSSAPHYTINMRHCRGSFVMFKFYVDGEALSEGQLHEASTKAPNLHFAKAHIDTHPVQVTY